MRLIPGSGDAATVENRWAASSPAPGRQWPPRKPGRPAPAGNVLDLLLAPILKDEGQAVQQPHPPLYMSGSSPEAGEFAARNHIGIGFAFTTVPLAKSAVQHYRACARDAGWEATAEDVIYRAMFHVADTDEEAFADMSKLPPRISLVDQNKAIAEGVRQSGYYGADAVAQRQRTSRRELADRIALGQVIVGGPDTVLAQVRHIRDELGAGILDLVVGAQLGDRTLHSIELFGSKVLPRMREL